MSERTIVDRVDELENRLDEAEDRIEELESEGHAVESLDEIPQRVENSEDLTEGQEVLTTIQEMPGQADKDPIARLDGLVTFVEVNGHEVSRGDDVEAKITRVGDSHAEAMMTGPA